MSLFIHHSNDYLFGFNGMEKDNEIKGSGNSYDFGARIYDPRIGRWMSTDPSQAKYPSLSPYNFVANTPIQAIDPDGKDIFLIVWFTQKGEVGHAGIAVENYKTVYREVVEPNGFVIDKPVQIKDGTVTYYDFWPSIGVGKGNFLDDVGGEIQRITGIETSKLIDDDNFDPSEEEDRGAEGMIRIYTNISIDNNINAYLSKEYNKQLDADPNNDPMYCGLGNNCSDFAVDAINKIGGDFNTVDGIENISTGGNKLLSIPKIDKNAVTPNFLFKDIKDIISKNTKRGEVIRDKGGSDTDFVNGATRGLLKDKTPGQ